MATLYQYFFPFFDKWGEGYPSNVYIKLQTLALLKGDFRVGDTPFDLMPDWAWANGVQQVWGLGLPLLYSPFEWIWQLLCSEHFPDRAAFSLLFTVSVVLLSSALGKPIGHKVLGTVFIIAALGSVLGHPIFGGLLATRFSHLEEHSLSGQLVVLVAISSAVFFIEKPTLLRKYFLIFLTSGLVWFRPTLAIYSGALIVGVTFVYYNEKSKREALSFLKLSAAALIASFIFLAATNKVRFGEYREFGHRLNSVGNSIKTFEWKFGSGIENEEFTKKAYDIFYTMFFPQPLNGPIHHHSIFESNGYLLRSRSFIHSHYSIWEFLLVSLGLFYTFIFLRRSGELSTSLRALTFSAVLVLVTLFIFYSLTPHIATRYYLDFFAAWITLKILLIYLFLRCLRHAGRPVVTMVISALFLTLFIAVAIYDWRHQSSLDSNMRRHLVTFDEGLRLSSFFKRQPKVLPNNYTCDGPSPDSFILYNGSGWNHGKDCYVGPSTTFYFKSFNCIEIKYRTVYKSFPRVKRNLKFLERIKTQAHEAGYQVTEFCANEPSELAFDSLFVSWINSEDLLKVVQPTVLKSIRVW
ncbi:MAG: hypothetical protein COT74_05185 [Bdellovibrionales bacterium CG10_big_fil_rev_8_21_14_0_10_45_34]|nr:MAG: hypothetical protein COT74_05185 [Bdellovibrionales bacterium CG10_big_fil_rev_8_21_14_0_10_45_34]